MGFSLAFGIDLGDSFSNLLLLIAKTIVNSHGQVVKLTDLVNADGVWTDDDFVVTELYDDIHLSYDEQQAYNSFEFNPSYDDTFPEFIMINNFSYKPDRVVRIGNPHGGRLMIYLGTGYGVNYFNSIKEYKFQTLQNFMNWVTELRTTPSTLDPSQFRLVPRKDGDFLEVTNDY